MAYERQVDPSKTILMRPHLVRVFPSCIWQISSVLLVVSMTVMVASGQLVHLGAYDRFSPVWDGNCSAGLCNASVPCVVASTIVTTQDCAVHLLQGFDTNLDVDSGPYKLTLSSEGLITTANAPFTLLSSNQISLFNFGLSLNNTDAFVNITAPSVLVRLSELIIGRSNWIFGNVADLQFLNSQVKSYQASEAIHIIADLAASERSLLMDQLTVDHDINTVGVTFHIISSATMNVTVRGASGRCNQLVRGDIEALEVRDTNLSLMDVDSSSQPLFYSTTSGPSKFSNSTFTCVAFCADYSALHQRDGVLSALDVQKVILRGLAILRGSVVHPIGSEAFIDLVDSDHTLGAIGSGRGSPSISILRSKFVSNFHFPVIDYTGNTDPIMCIQLTQMEKLDGTSKPPFQISVGSDVPTLILSCLSSVPYLHLTTRMAFNGTLVITKLVSGSSEMVLEVGPEAALILGASLSIQNLSVDGREGHFTYIPSEPLEGISNNVLYGMIHPVPPDWASQFKIVWPLTLPAPLPGLLYPLFPYSDVPITTDYSFDSSHILLESNGTWLNWAYDPVPCNSNCIANSSAMCATSDRCSCLPNWYGPLCDCDQSMAPPGVVCSVYGGRNWVLDGSMFLPPNSAVNLSSSYTLNVNGDMHLDGTVGMNDGTVVVATGIIYSNGKLTGLCKLREFHHNGACVVYSTVSVQSYALEFSNLTEIELILDASDLTTDGSCVPPNPPGSLDHLINATFNAFTHSFMSTNASWSFKIISGRNASNPQDQQKIAFQTKILKSGDIDKSSGSTTKLLASSSGSNSCASAVNPTGTMTLFVGPCSDSGSPTKGKGPIAWYIIAIPIIGAVLLILGFALLLFKVDAVRNLILPYHKTN